VASFEAKYMASQQALRRLNGQLAVLRLQVEAARGSFRDIRDLVEEIAPGLIGEERRGAERIDRLCQEWEDRADSIRIADPEDPA
jgi:hypothetical protein